MRRIFLLLSVVALAAGLHACSADAPTPTPPRGNSGGSNALQVRLFTNNANPTAGFCTQIEAVATLNGANVPDGTGVAFSTDFGFFQQNLLPLVSVVTTNGTAVTAVCSNSVGVAKVKASVTVGTATATATLSISFQPSAQAVPFFSFCSPNLGPNTGGTSLTINGGRFFGSASTTRVTFTALGITREAIVQSVSATALTVLTPAFPEALSPSVPVDITITFGTNTGSPVVVSAPNCFVYGTTTGDTPSITAVLPSTGPNEGGTRVTIIGSGFQAPMQVFFGTVEAPPPVSVTFNKIIVLSPPATPQSGQVNAAVTIRAHNVASGKDSQSTTASTFTYVTKILITAWTNNVQSINGPLTPVTIFGQGFSSPMAVSLAGFGAAISSVSATELVVVPGNALATGCADIVGPIVVTNVSNGDSDSKGSFTYLVKATGPIVSGVAPSAAQFFPGLTVTVTGSNFPTSANLVEVTFGGRTAGVISSAPSAIVVSVPNNGITTIPVCTAGQLAGTQVGVETVDVTVTNRTTTCAATASKAFTYTLPCAVPTPTP